jgi:hypothetical protein
MKKQIIAAAVAASVSAVALADVSISGAAQVNINKVDSATTLQPTVTHDVDVKIVGKSGDTTFTVDMEDAISSSSDDNAFAVKNAYMNTSVGGMNLKVGSWFNGDSNLNNATQQNPRAELSTTLGAASVKFAAEPGATKPLYEMHLGADLAGVKVNYEQENSLNDNHKILSVGGSLAGVDFSFTDSRSDSEAGQRLTTAGTVGAEGGPVFNDISGFDKNKEQNMAISTNVGGMKVEYQKMKSDAGTTSDGFFGTFSKANLLEADGFGITTSFAGNTVQIRNYKTLTEAAIDTDADADGVAEADDVVGSVPTADRDTKIIVTRPLASGATAEFIYVTGDSKSVMDLEFRMKF